MHPDDILRYPLGWTKEVRKLYFNKFLLNYRRGRYRVSVDTFSNTEILDCLERELRSPNTVRKHVRKILEGKNVESILVLGPGSGGMGNALRNLYGTSTLFEVDINPFVINRLKQKYHKDVMRRPIIGSASNIPRESHSIDLVVAYSVFRYINDTERVCREIERILKPNGFAFVAEGKKKEIIDKIKYSLLKLKIDSSLSRVVIPTVRLPHLTFFYWLLSAYQKNQLVEKIVNREMKNKSISLVEAAFNIAGSSLGTIYGISWKKHD